MSHNDTIDRAFANGLLDVMLPGALDTTQGYDLRAPISVKEEPVDASPATYSLMRLSVVPVCRPCPAGLMYRPRMLECR